MINTTPKIGLLLEPHLSVRAVKEGVAKPLLVTSKETFSVKDIRPFVDEGHTVAKRAGDSGGPLALAMASELSNPPDSKEKHGPRMVVVGSANVAFGQA